MVGTVNHQQPFWFYIPVALGGLFPWSLVAILAAVAAFSKLTENKANLVSLIKNRKQLNDRTAYLFFMTIWAVFVLVLLVLLKPKNFPPIFCQAYRP